MKSLIVAVVVLSIFLNSAVIGLSMPERYKKAVILLHNHCVAETEVDESLIFESRGGMIPDDKKLSCYIDCLFRTSGLIDDDGKIRFGDISNIFPDEIKEVVDKITGKCNTIHGEDHCETAYLTVKCYLEADPDVLKLI